MVTRRLSILDSPGTSLAVRVYFEGTYYYLDADYDIANQWYDGQGWHGFDFLVAVPPLSSRNVCVDARNPVTGAWFRAGCRPVNIKGVQDGFESMAALEFCSTRFNRNRYAQYPVSITYFNQLGTSTARGQAIVNGLNAAPAQSGGRLLTTQLFSPSGVQLTVQVATIGAIARVQELRTTCGRWIFGESSDLDHPSLVGCYVLSGLVWVGPNFSSANGTRTIIHELGHVLGLAHTNHVGAGLSIMKDPPEATNFTAIDRQNLSVLFR